MTASPPELAGVGTSLTAAALKGVPVSYVRLLIAVPPISARAILMLPPPVRMLPTICIPYFRLPWERKQKNIFKTDEKFQLKWADGIEISEKYRPN